jgi:hypothetical protein
MVGRLAQAPSPIVASTSAWRNKKQPLFCDAPLADPNGPPAEVVRTHSAEIRDLWSLTRQLAGRTEPTHDNFFAQGMIWTSIAIPRPLPKPLTFRVKKDESKR